MRALPLAFRSLGPILLCACLLVVAAPVAAQQGQAPVQLNWQRGPVTAAIGHGLAEIDLDGDYLYLGAEDTKRLMTYMENPTSGQELATITPVDESANWFIVFEFDPMGYVPDSEKDELDATAILESIRQGTEAANEERRRRGWATMSIVGWHEAPHYDESTNLLSWAVIGESQGFRNVNRIVKLLGRRGVMTATLVASPEELGAAIPAASTLLTGYRFQPGNTYAEYVPGKDKLAEYGLAALVVGGAGAALAKSGLLARLWKPIALMLAALGAGLKRMLFSGRSAEHSAGQPIS